MPEIGTQHDADIGVLIVGVVSAHENLGEQNPDVGAGIRSAPTLLPVEKRGAGRGLLFGRFEEPMSCTRRQKNGL
jgi:hypothetical protein